MAIVGYLSDIFERNLLTERMRNGLHYLQKLPASFMQQQVNGFFEKVEIQHKDLFALNQVYESKPLSEAKFEAHHQHIDLQFIIAGEERIKIEPRRHLSSVIPYDTEKDIEFFETVEGSDLLLKPGMVAIFFPEDGHAPGLQVHKPVLVRKSVVKVKILP